tara:strand:- start:546 stop:1121 length:576 start_codon:yes stop_codon:yes gene_type:complete
MNIRLLQTLQDRESEPTSLEDNGPYKCRKNRAWLTEGYYFWDTHIELGHWWGETIYGIGRYIICEAKAILDVSCWDLQGNGAHRIELKDACDLMVKSGITTRERVKVPTVIQYLRENGLMKYNSVRALGVQSMSDKSSFYYALPFPGNNNGRKPAYLEIHPAVQVCLFERTALSLRSFKIVYPEHYCEEYV